jgi:opacity protein-like surface antigen
MKNKTPKTLLKSLALGALSALVVSAAHAGPMYSSPSKKQTIVQPPPPQPSCFYAGELTLDAFAAGIIASNDGLYEDGVGGGVGLNYFFTKEIGVGLDAYWYDSEEVIHSGSASLIVRYPMDEICLAPYAFAGGGVHADSENIGSFHAGGGLDYRLTDTVGLFADGRYVWTGEDKNDFVTVRLGLRFRF